MSIPNPPQDIHIPARDGFRLSTTLFRPSEHGTKVVMVNGATAVARRFYRTFATALAEAGFIVLTYDYRGLGDSRPPHLRGFEATMRDWALLDMAGVVDWVLSEFEPERLLFVGHSAGGQVAGMLDNAEHVHGMITVSSQSGHWRLQGGGRASVFFHIHVTFPLLATVLGYFPWSRIMKGEDLPKGVALEWARWCRHPDYLLGDTTLPLDRFAHFEAPILAYSIADDDWGSARSVDAMMRAYPHVERRHLDPTFLGLPSLGHFGYFKPTARTLWDEAIQWLDAC